GVDGDDVVGGDVAAEVVMVHGCGGGAWLWWWCVE
ncbi:hypothetical protein Tco_1288418, partial [Tanacetum coccineum]